MKFSIVTCILLETDRVKQKMKFEKRNS